MRSAAWHAAWRRVAACHAVSVAVGAVGAHAAGGGLQPDGGLAWLGQQLLWAAAVGLVAAQGPRAMLAALYPNGSEGGGGDGVVAAGGQVQLCVAAVGLAAVVLRGAHLLMGQWVRCCTFLLLAVPLYALCPVRPGTTRGQLGRAALLAGGAAALWHAHRHLGAAWLTHLLAPHLLLLACGML